MTSITEVLRIWLPVETCARGGQLRSLRRIGTLQRRTHTMGWILISAEIQIKQGQSGATLPMQRRDGNTAMRWRKAIRKVCGDTRLPSIEESRLLPEMAILAKTGACYHHKFTITSLKTIHMMAWRVTIAETHSMVNLSIQSGATQQILQRDGTSVTLSMKLQKLKYQLLLPWKIFPWRTVELDIEAHNRWQWAVEFANTGALKPLMNTVILLRRTQKLIWDLTSAETLMARRQSGVIRQIQTRGGNTVKKENQKTSKAFGERRVLVIEDCNLKLGLEGNARLGMNRSHMCTQCCLRAMEMASFFQTTVEIQRVLKKLFGAIPLILKRDGSSATLSISTVSHRAKKRLRAMVCLTWALNQGQRACLCVKTGAHNTHTSMKTRLRTDHSLICIQTSAEIQMALKQFGAILMTQKWSGNTARKLTHLTRRAFGVIREHFIEDTRPWLEVELHAKHGMLLNHKFQTIIQLISPTVA